MLHQPRARPTRDTELLQSAGGFLAHGDKGIPPAHRPGEGFPATSSVGKTKAVSSHELPPDLWHPRGQGRQPRRGGRSGMKNTLGSKNLWSSSSVHASEGAGGSPAVSPTCCRGISRHGLIGSRGKVGSKGQQGRRGGAMPFTPTPGMLRAGIPTAPCPLAPRDRARCLPACRCLQDVVCNASGRAAAGAWHAACSPSLDLARLAAQLTLSPSFPRSLGDGELRGAVSAGLPGGLDPVPHQILRGLAPAIVPFPCAALLSFPHRRATSVRTGRRPRDPPRMHPPFYQPRFPAEIPAPPLPKPGRGFSFPSRVTSREVPWEERHHLLVPSPYFWPDPQHVPPAPWGS